VSVPRKNITVTWEYHDSPEACLSALITLLKKPVSNESSPSPATLDDDGRIRRFRR
jgi:hypothetical protein